MASAERCKTHRRYLFVKARALRSKGEESIADAFNAKRLAEPGTQLPATFPHRAAVLAAGYLVIEELDGETQSELEASGLTQSQAASVLAAIP